MKPTRNITRLLEIMAALRDKQTGCPWDIEQDFRSIAPYTIEEAFEVADAIERGDMVNLEEELGDLLLQVVYHAQMAAEEGLFSFDDVVLGVNRKMVRRHPHVFGDEPARNAGMAKGAWERIKAEEKAEKAAKQRASGNETPPANGLLADVPNNLPALMRAVKLQAKAGKVGFDWNDPRAVIAKMREELDEVEEALNAQNRDAQEDEIGDMLFAIANLARHLEIDPEAAVRRTNQKFLTRFAYIESQARQAGKNLKDMPLDEMEALWQAAKKSG